MKLSPPVLAHKKASLSKDRLGLARSRETLDMFILFARLLTSFRIPAANLSCPIFFFARLSRFWIFWSAIWKNYVARSGQELWRSSLPPSCIFILFMQAWLCSHVSLYFSPCENAFLYKKKKTTFFYRYMHIIRKKYVELLTFYYFIISVYKTYINLISVFCKKRKTATEHIIYTHSYLTLLIG